MLKLESRRKDKSISKKNFQIQQLLEKVTLLESSNACLFKELDQSINSMSVVALTTQIDIVNEYLDNPD